MSGRVALTRADWEKFGRAATRWADDASGDQFRAAVEEIVRARLAKAWATGYNRGWRDGVNDANRDDGGGMATPRPNPFRVAS